MLTILSKLSKSDLYEWFSTQHRRLRWAYQIVSHFYHRFSALKFSQLHQLRIAKPSGQPISFYSNNLKLRGDFYPPAGNSKGETILLLHGSSIFGRKLALIQAWAKEFQQRGYAVLAFDLRAYGESDDPQIFTPAAFDFAQDVRSAIDFLLSHAPANGNRFYVIGHSFGGAVALVAQAVDPRIAKIVSFGPPRRLSERFLNPEAREKQKLLVRWQADMQLDQPLNFNLWQQVLQPLNIENYAAAFSQTGHTPVFLIDAETEPTADLEFLRTFYRGVAPPADYWTVPQTDHYLGTGFLFGQPCYYTGIVQAFVNRVDQWLQQSEER